VLPAILLVAQLSLGAGRPPECGVGGNLRGTNIWERAKHPELRRYCDLLATGTSKLVSPATAGDALREADEADAVMRGHAAPLVLKGRALAKLGRFTEAYAAFGEAKRRDARALDDPAALLAFARSAARSGHAPEALAAFRSLLPRADGLSSSERAPAYVEAAIQAMNASTRAASSLDDAIAMLRQARREATDALQPIATLALALALDRQGAHDEARAVLDDRARAAARSVAREATVTALLGPLAYEAQAMAALGLEGTDASASQAAWQAFVAAAPQSPWLEHAKSHLSSAPRAAHRGRHR
jgi:tetratricopeptide (TPR) repeat protein